MSCRVTGVSQCDFCLVARTRRTASKRKGKDSSSQVRSTLPHLSCFLPPYPRQLRQLWSNVLQVASGNGVRTMSLVYVFYWTIGRSLVLICSPKWIILWPISPKITNLELILLSTLGRVSSSVYNWFPFFSLVSGNMKKALVMLGEFASTMLLPTAHPH